MPDGGKGKQDPAVGELSGKSGLQACLAFALAALCPISRILPAVWVRLGPCAEAWLYGHTLGDGRNGIV